MRRRALLSPAICVLTLVGAPQASSAQSAIDVTPPQVTVFTPRAGAVVPSGLVVRAGVTDDIGVTEVWFRVNGITIAAETIAPYWTVWDTSTVAEGPHTLTVIASDAAGNTGTAEIPVTVDRTPPAVRVSTPSDGGIVSGLVSVSADASDQGGIDRVSFTVNGVPVGEHAAPPYAVVWDTRLLADGEYTIAAAARDAAGGLNRHETTVTLRNGTSRIDHGDARVAYSGVWAEENAGLRPWFGGTAAIALLTAFAAQATLTFDGVGASWVGFRGPQAGIAHVYVDHVRVATVDLYAPVEHAQDIVFTAGGLTPGTHTLTVEATGAWNPLSTDPFVVVDGFIVIGPEAGYTP